MQISARSLPGQPRGNTINFYLFPGPSKETLIQMEEQFYFSRVRLVGSPISVCQLSEV